MKIIRNNDIILSLNKGKIDILFESIDDIVSVFPVSNVGSLISLKKNEENPKFVGYVKHYLFQPVPDRYDFVPVYKDSDDFEIIYDKVRLYNDLLIPVEHEIDFRNKMMKADRGEIEGFYKLKHFE